jgi:IS5 family transposase
METVVPWSELEALIEPYYPKAGKGRHPVGLHTMLRIYFLQHWFNLSDTGAEDALYDSPALRGFAGVDLGRAAAPDETTILNFRHLLENHDLCGKIFDVVNLYLDSKGMCISTGTIVDATIIAAPSSTKNSKKERDPRCIRPRKATSITSEPRRTSVSIAIPAWCIRSARLRLRCMTSIWCPTYCMARKRRFGETAAIKGKRR